MKALTLIIVFCTTLFAAVNDTTVDSAVAKRIYMGNYNYNTCIASQPILSIRWASDVNRPVFKNRSGTLYKALTDASTSSNTPQGRVFYADATGSAGSSANLSFDGSRLSITGKLSLTDTITGANGTFTGVLSSATINTGNGTNELYPMDQDVRTTASPNFLTLNTDTVFTRKIKGTGGTNAAYGLQLLSNTIDGSDSLRVVLNGGGEAGTSRGGRITAYGNEHTTAAGVVAIAAGDAAGSRISLTTTSANSYINANPRFVVGSNTPTHIPYIGFDCQPTFKFRKMVSNLYDSAGWRYYENSLPAGVLDFTRLVGTRYGLQLAYANSGGITPNLAALKTIMFADTMGIVFGDTIIENGYTKIVGNAKVTRRIVSDSIYSTDGNNNIHIGVDPSWGNEIKLTTQRVKTNNDILTPRITLASTEGDNELSISRTGDNIVVGKIGTAPHDEIVIMSTLATDSSLIIAGDSVKVKKIKANVFGDTGTFSMTAYGYTTTPTYSVRYTKIGDIVTLSIPAVSGTSNSTQWYLGALPAALRPESPTYATFSNNFYVDGVEYYKSVPVMITYADGYIYFYHWSNSMGSWTASGTKRWYSKGTITYSMK